MLKLPKNDSKYSWTSHAAQKMQHYGISESRVKRIVRYPNRIEEGIAEGCIAAMQPAGTKRYQELWVMYKLAKSNIKNQKSKIKVITAWRYPGKSEARDPIPREIIDEVRTLL